eukprot:scaffold3125_cov118-Skeletonema_dohrnii-CCMP3373.AAC.2
MREEVGCVNEVNTYLMISAKKCVVPGQKLGEKRMSGGGKAKGEKIFCQQKPTRNNTQRNHMNQKSEV